MMSPAIQCAGDRLATPRAVRGMRAARSARPAGRRRPRGDRGDAEHQRSGLVMRPPPCESAEHEHPAPYRPDPRSERGSESRSGAPRNPRQACAARPTPTTDLLEAALRSAIRAPRDQREGRDARSCRDPRHAAARGRRPMSAPASRGHDLDELPARSSRYRSPGCRRGRGRDRHRRARPGRRGGRRRRPRRGRSPGCTCRRACR